MDWDKNEDEDGDDDDDDDDDDVDECESEGEAQDEVLELPRSCCHVRAELRSWVVELLSCH